MAFRDGIDPSLQASILIIRLYALQSFGTTRGARAASTIASASHRGGDRVVGARSGAPSATAVGAVVPVSARTTGVGVGVPAAERSASVALFCGGRTPTPPPEDRAPAPRTSPHARAQTPR